jgi:hypothetical protein
VHHFSNLLSVRLSGGQPDRPGAPLSGLLSRMKIDTAILTLPRVKTTTFVFFTFLHFLLALVKG